jgi:cytochrome c-type biogenesis protein CcmH
MTLWAILTIMTSAAAVFLAAPFLRRLDQPREAPAARDIEIYRDQLAEVEKETAAGLIDSDQAETASVEIKRRLLAADRASGPMLARFSLGERNFAAVAVAGIVVLGSVGLYALNGSPDLPSTPAQVGSARQPEASAVDQLAAAMLPPGGEGQSLSHSQARLGTVDEMIGRVVERLKRNPNDPEGWRMLGWSYFNTERFAQSAAAYAKAIELNPQDAEFRSSRGEALVRAADGLVTDEAKAVFAQALRLDAKDPKGRFFTGLAKEQIGDKMAALDDWVAILNDSDSNDAWVTDLRQRVTELGRETGVDLSARLHPLKPAATGGLLGMLQQQQTAPPAVAPGSGGPSTEDVRNAAAMTPSDRVAMIQGMVDRLASRLDQSPRDVDGWIKLMRSRKVLGETEAAEQTFRFALDVFKDAPREQEQIASAARELELIK